MPLGGKIGIISHDQTTWLVLPCLLLGVIAPTACVLWFMNQAAKTEATAARQEITEAYRNELRIGRDQVETYWETRAAALHAESPRDFQRIVTSRLADSVVFLASTPRPSVPPVESSEWSSAQILEDRRDLTGAAAAYARIADTGNNPDLAARGA